MRRRKGAEYVKPKVVVPEKIQKKGKQEDLADLAVQLEAGVPVHGEVRQFQYQYYQFELPERLNLVIALRASQGDPDLFVSNEVMTPKQEPSEHTWRGAATGDDEVLISIDHPRYALGTYWIGVYSGTEQAAAPFLFCLGSRSACCSCVWGPTSHAPGFFFSCACRLSAAARWRWIPSGWHSWPWLLT